MSTNALTKNQLIYCTVMINAKNETNSEQGTGFIVVNNHGYHYIVTNYHVVENRYSASFLFCQKIKDNTSTDTTQNVEVYDLKERIYYQNDDTDICLIYINDIINEAQCKGIPLYYQCVPSKCFIDENEDDISLSSIEDVIMVGYPEGIYDENNCKPVIRKGITATDIHLDFNNNKEFLIDIAAFNGSSGSPVFLERQDMSIDQKSNKIVIISKYYLSGIIKTGYAEEDKKCNYRFTELLNGSKVELVFDYMLNLGIVIKSKKILDLLVCSESIDYKNKHFDLCKFMELT